MSERGVAIVVRLAAVLLLLGACRHGSNPSAPAPKVTKTEPPSRSSERDTSMDELKAKVDNLVRSAEKADRELAQTQADASKRENDAQGARRAEADPQGVLTNAQRAQAAFGPTLSSLTTLINRYSEEYSQYVRDCHGKSTRTWLLALADPNAQGDLVGVQTQMANEITPECRTLAADAQADANTIVNTFNVMENRAAAMRIAPGYLRQLYLNYGVVEIADAVIRR